MQLLKLNTVPLLNNEYCAVVEYCGIASRTLPLMTMIVSYTLASLLLPILTALLPSWNLLAFIAASSVLPVLLCWRCVCSHECLFNCTIRLVPESPSWLLVKGRQGEALQQLEKIAKWNKTDFQVRRETGNDSIPNQQLDEAKNELDGLIRNDISANEEEKTSLLQMFLTPNLQINASLCVFIWFVSYE